MIEYILWFKSIRIFKVYLDKPLPLENQDTYMIGLILANNKKNYFSKTIQP